MLQVHRQRVSQQRRRAMPCCMAMVGKIVSGAQTGVDRAALDVALELGLAIGGWIPRGRRAEDGRIPCRYRGLAETDSAEYGCRTEWNVRDSDATVIFAPGAPAGGTALTARAATMHGRPLLTLDLEKCTPEEAVLRLRNFLLETRPRVLNIAGPRASEAPEIGLFVTRILRGALAPPPD